MFELPTREPELFRRMSDGQSRGWVPANNETYAQMIELNRFVDGLRRQRN